MKNTTTISTVKVGIIDDHELFTQSVGGLINKLPGFATVLEALDGQDLLNQLKEMGEQPDILLMDIYMEGMDGIEATRQVTELYPTIKIIALSSMVILADILKMMRAGSCAYLKKDVTPQELEQALLEVYTKGKFHADIYSQNANRLKSLEETIASFTEKEIRFLQYMVDGYTYVQIADKLELGPTSKKTYKTTLFLKLNVTNSIAMIMEALRLGLVSLD